MRAQRIPHPDDSEASNGGFMDSLVLPAQSPAPSHVQARLAIAHKFGGSSLADADGFRRVADNLRARGDATQVVVASAMQGVTDALLALVDNAVRRSPSWSRDLRDLRDRHCATANELLGLAAPATLDWLRLRF